MKEHLPLLLPVLSLSYSSCLGTVGSLWLIGGRKERRRILPNSAVHDCMSCMEITAAVISNPLSPRHAGFHFLLFYLLYLISVRKSLEVRRLHLDVNNLSHVLLPPLRGMDSGHADGGVEVEVNTMPLVISVCVLEEKGERWSKRQNVRHNEQTWMWTQRPCNGHFMQTEGQN
jgi:hypothetical protein